MIKRTLLFSALLVTVLSCKMEKKEEQKQEDEKSINTQKDAKEVMNLRPVTDNAVDNEYIKNENFTEIDKKAEYPGDIATFNKQFISRLRTPDLPRSIKRIQVIIQFTIEVDGSVTDIKTLKDPGYGAAKEAIRVLNSMPKWIPAELNDKKVRSQFTLPITIQVQ
ncbi:energy transducer TonB [Myroides odoratimimus]|uniref:energy transducer TonB n=1 Tax=Myroides odoratimimus TaxID=76832 RepID=UPI002DB719A8|nr:energy transducer TonB [Myroides odoratimimus]MEC4052565.1 energy transducer TonB [Myroides odoratimimus]